MMILSGLGKRGQIRDFVAVIVFLFIFIVLTLIGYLILDSMVAAFNVAYTSPTIVRVGGQFLSSLAIIDYLVVIIMAALIVGVGVSSYKVSAHPVFFVVTFVVAPLLGVFSFFMNYGFSQIVSNVEFAGVVGFFPRSILIGTNFHWIMLVCIVVGSVSLYAKKDKGQYLE